MIYSVQELLKQFFIVIWCKRRIYHSYLHIGVSKKWKHMIHFVPSYVEWVLIKWLFHKSAMLIYKSSTMLPKIQVVSMPIHFTESYILLTEILEENSKILNRLFKIQQTSVISNSKGTKDFVRNSECLKYRSFKNLT